MEKGSHPRFYEKAVVPARQCRAEHNLVVVFTIYLKKAVVLHESSLYTQGKGLTMIFLSPKKKAASGLFPGNLGTGQVI
jgi:hypothetical protein